MAGFFDSIFGGGDSAKELPPLQLAQFSGSAPTPFAYQNPLAPQTFNVDPNQMYGSANAIYGGLGSLPNYNMYAQTLPQAGGIAQGMVNSPYAGGYQAGAGTASQLGGMAALGQFGTGGQILNTAFDPQQDLYNRTLAQTTDAARAGAAARGLGDTPWGAGVENQAVRDFNINWQNQQLQRQIAGGQAGTQMQAGAAPLFMQSAAMPWQTQQQIGNANLGTLGQLGQFGAAGAAQQGNLNQQYLNYLSTLSGLQGQANQANLANYYAGLAGQAQNFGQQQTANFLDPMQLAQFQQGQFNQQAQQALANEKQASSETQSMLGGLGKLAGGIWGTGLAGGGTVGGAAMGGLGNLASTAMSFLPMLSDAREKEDIVPVGVDPDTGLTMYAYRYRGDPKHYPKVVGPIAQEVAAISPENVTEIGGRLFIRGMAGLGSF